MYLLIDCDNFFASVEQIFNPSLRNRPLVILSGNDGCVVARSKEAKALKIPMGAPYFQYKNLFLIHNVHTLSTNHTLYSDISRRIISIIQEFSFPTEVYSIDEMFLRVNKDLPFILDLAHMIRSRVKKWIGITLSIGIAPTKTLAKMASKIAKTNNGMFSLTSKETRNDQLKLFPIEDVWGVGSAAQKKLKARFIYTAYDFSMCSEEWIRKELTIQGLRIAKELRGTEAITLQSHLPKKSISISRTFPREINSFSELRLKLIQFCEKLACSLRKIPRDTELLIVSLSTNRFSKEIPFHQKSQPNALNEATSFTPTLIKHAVHTLKSIYLDGYSYKKLSLTFTNLVEPSAQQTNFLHNDKIPKSSQKALMKTLDHINLKYGSDSISYAQSRKKEKSPALRSQEYTTRWDQLLSAQ